MPRRMFERDLVPVAFTEKESDADKNRRDSWVTKVPEEGDDLEEFEESDECQWFDDRVGGVAQVATPQMFDISSDLDGESEEPVLPEMPFAPPEGDYGDDSETTEHLEQFRHEQGRDTLVSASGSSGSSYQEPVLPEMPFAPPEGDYGDDSETTENLEQFGHEQGRDTLVSASGSSGSSYQEPVLPEMPFAPPEGDYGDDSETTENLEQFGHEQGRDTLVSASGSSGSSYQDFDTGWEYLYDGLVCPEVTEVLEYNLQAVSRNFSSREVWMTHLFNLLDFDSFQPVTGIPTAPVWHPIEEFSAFARIAAKCTDKSLSTRERITSPPVAQFRAEASEGFQGCFQALCGPWAKKLQGNYLAHVKLVRKKGDARFLGDR
ncbi:unnamed protein product [Cladocopium goreaui]|uniref:Uncharacterized protein n=1 Tax=Cladocopium goreaui TaxID=2562237 RepID=A0A9P1BQZ4_9DINO|nr:unnamed protein product [Cladocopium goreaui]